MSQRSIDLAATLLTASRLLVGTENRLVPEPAVLVRAGRIEWVGTHRSPPPEHVAGSRRIDLPGATLLPGFVEAHTHLSFDAGDDPQGRVRSADDAEVVELMLASAGALLSAGVTTARDLGAPRYLDVAVRERIRTGAAPGPDLLLATTPLTTYGGHLWFLGGQSRDEAELRDLVRANRERGADWIKVMVTGGFTTGPSSPFTPQFESSAVRAVVEEAHSLGMRVAAHAHATSGIRVALDTGVDTVEHCTWLTPNGFDIDLGLVNRLADRGPVVCPTVNHSARQAQGRLPWESRSAHLRMMRDAGVRFAVGTDSGIPRSPHDRYVDSLPPYEDLGMTPLEVIELATHGTASALGIGDVTGSVEVGKRADVLAVDGDPSGDLQDLQNLTFVMADGLVHYHEPTRSASTGQGAR